MERPCPDHRIYTTLSGSIEHLRLLGDSFVAGLDELLSARISKPTSAGWAAPIWGS
ncbi:hypothetical protein [Mesorhizobium sp. URHB0026]